MADVVVERPPPVNLITNGDFETGDLTGWTHSGSKVINSSATSHGGSRSARLGSTQDGWETSSELYQAIDVPATGTTTLTFWAYGACPSGNGVQEAEIWDEFWIDNLHTIFYDCSNERIWKFKSVDLTAYAGTRVNLDFYVSPEFTSFAVWLYVDDVIVTNQ
jgi:hypothetical protein